jgi:hypothetical protein
MQVAAWDVYVKALATEYFNVSANVSDPRFTAIHNLVMQAMTTAKEKLNTPNSENSRNFLTQYTGFDPWPHWINIKFGSAIFTSTFLVSARMNEIFKLRHSFAHGFSMPAYSWNQSPAGAAHLTSEIVRSTGRFFLSICKETDAAMGAHIAAQHCIRAPW